MDHQSRYKQLKDEVQDLTNRKAELERKLKEMKQMQDRVKSLRSDISDLERQLENMK